MAEVVLLTLIRFVLPITLIYATLCRPVGISILYLLMFFVTPWLLLSKSKTQQRVLLAFLIFACLMGALITIGHLVINFCDLFLSYLSSTNMTTILRQVGFIRFSRVKPIAILHWILPDIMVAILALIMIIFMKVSPITKGLGNKSDEDIDDESEMSKKNSEMNRMFIVSYVRAFLKSSPIFVLIALYIASILRPSIPGSFYFLIFIVAGTYWALYKTLRGGLFYSLVLVIIELPAQMACIVFYQLPIMQKYLKPDSIWARVMGFEALLLMFDQNRDGKIMELNKTLYLDSYLSPVALMFAYFVIIQNVAHYKRNKDIFNTIRMQIGEKSNGKSPEEPNPLMEETLTATAEPPSTLEQFFYLICDVTTAMYQNSYILLNIVMMIWSIIYHSWLTFVLLIWANVLWMIPNHRSSMMRSSFFIVVYAEFLLIIQYVFGMNFNESELPTKLAELNLMQIGFQHHWNYDVQPCVSLVVKTMFLCVFWITSHQYFKEQSHRKSRTDILLQIFGKRFTSETTIFEKSRAPQIIIFIYKSLSNFVTRIWMWILIFLIFLCAMIDSDMTGFRICYMSLFLLFLMVFQMSLQLWVKFLYGYWVFMIFYAMTILTIIYTYQFDYFDHYWEQYLHVQFALQKDIGLRRFRTRDLFLNLLVPTLTVIFTVIQIHYFHRRFMESVHYPGPTDRRFSVGSPPKNNTHKKSSSKAIRFLMICYRKFRSTINRWFRPSKQVIWRFLEMHMIKAVILTTFACALSETCCFNLILVVLSLASLCVNRTIRRFIFRVATFWVSVQILMKMIFQMKYFDKSKYNFTCDNQTVNFASWMGLHKTADHAEGSLLRYLAPYIINIIVTSLHAVVKLRDHLIRYSLGGDRDRSVLFPGIIRQDAERNFSGLLKYLCNFGFFKFGLEITFIALVSSIVNRRDFLAITYIIWLILLLCLTRVQCARLWNFFQIYFGISVFLQYIYLIHFPPNLCIAAIPESQYDIQSFSTILNNPSKFKVMLDFIVLLLITRQSKAFKAELRQLNNIAYPGGDNRNIVDNIAKLGHVYFKNPTHDFLSFVRNYGDIFKSFVFFSYLWIALAVIFMGGICSMDMLSLGYLIFALIFLLQGSEVYLQNIYYIICRWNFLIAFNVFNITIKVCIIVLGRLLGIKQKQDYQSLFAVMQYDPSLKPPEGIKIPEGTDSYNYQYGPNSLIFQNYLIWHAIIFAFIIFQLRIFRSYYFCHIIRDTQANTMLASRGAIIIQNLHYKQIFDRRECEKKRLENVKAKMERIKTSNLKSFIRQRIMSTEKTKATTPETGDKDQSQVALPSSSATLRYLNVIRLAITKKRDLRLHPHAVRTGDYYMFDGPDDRDDPVLYEEIDFLEKEDLLARQRLIAARKNKKDQNENVSDSEIDFDTHPLVKLTIDVIMLMTFQLNRLSRNYRFVNKVLSIEKKSLQDISTMNRLGVVNTAVMFSFLNQSLYERHLDPITDKPKDPETISNRSSTRSIDLTPIEHNECVQLFVAFWNAIIANSEVICYLAVFVNQTANSAIISLPMSFLVLYWGALTLPRPTKTFWVTLITYTLAMIFLKCILHQKIVLDQKLIQLANTMDFELFVKHGNAVYDLLLLVILFWHRYMLKKQGIWNTPIKDRNRSTASKQTRQVSGSEGKDNNTNTTGFQHDIDDLLRPAQENKYVYEQIESEYYRSAMMRLENKGGFFSGIKKFFIALLHKARLSTDVYTLMFLCDFINFFVLLFGFPKFVFRHKYNASVVETYIQGNKVPFSFLSMLIVQFSMIVAERAIYLRKALVAKIVYHFVTVIGIHIWMFFLVPYVTSHSFGETAPCIFYLIKCLHMLLSCYQMRCGYPKRILGNVFTKSYSMVNYVAFKVYMEVPFLYVLRTLLDWLCINTTLTVMEWIKMEDIFQSVFIVRCYRQMDTDFPVLRGVPKAFYTKCLIGGTIILILIVLIWSPLFLFALVGTVGKANIPRRADISLKIGHYEPIYVSQSYSGIQQFSYGNYRTLLSNLNYDVYASDHIMIYDSVDISAVKFDENSLTLWNMSPPDKKRLLDNLKSGVDMDIRLKLSFNCGGMSSTMSYETVYTLSKTEVTRRRLIELISNDMSNEKVIIPNILPKFLTVQKSVVAANIIKDYDGKAYRPITLQKKRDGGVVWWETHDYCDDKFYKNVLENLPLSDCKGGVVFYIFYDKSFPSAMSFFEKTGIIGLYTTCVYVVSRVVRSLIANNHRRIMFEDLPYVDRILKLCNDIYLVRETREYRLEEDLYAKLLFLYRSPETLIKWTRYKEEVSDDISNNQEGRNASQEIRDEQR